MSPRLRRSRRFILLLAAFIVIGTTSAWAWHNRAAYGRALFKRHIDARIDRALDAISAAPAQRSAIHATADRLMTTLGSMRSEHRGGLERGLQIFEADSIDQNAIAALRADRAAARQQMGDAVVGAMHEVYDVLTPAQRRTLAQFLREHTPERHHRGERMHRFMERRIDAALDAAEVTPAQRQTIDGLRDELRSAMSEQGMGPGGALERLSQVVSVLEGDRWDDEQIAALRAQHQAAAERIGDTMTQALVRLHDTLTAEQRHRLTEYVRSQRGRFAHGALGEVEPDGAAQHPDAPRQ